LLSEIGGLGGVLYAFFHMLGRYLNKEFMYNKITRTLYYVKSHLNAGKENQSESMNKSSKDALPLTSIVQFDYKDSVF
jgi:hypothetical protein